MALFDSRKESLVEPTGSRNECPLPKPDRNMRDPIAKRSGLSHSIFHASETVKHDCTEATRHVI